MSKRGKLTKNKSWTSIVRSKLFGKSKKSDPPSESLFQRAQSERPSRLSAQPSNIPSSESYFSDDTSTEKAPKKLRSQGSFKDWRSSEWDDANESPTAAMPEPIKSELANKSMSKGKSSGHSFRSLFSAASSTNEEAAPQATLALPTTVAKKSSVASASLLDTLEHIESGGHAHVEEDSQQTEVFRYTPPPTTSAAVNDIAPASDPEGEALRERIHRLMGTINSTNSETHRELKGSSYSMDAPQSSRDDFSAHDSEGAISPSRRASKLARQITSPLPSPTPRVKPSRITLSPQGITPLYVDTSTPSPSGFSGGKSTVENSDGGNDIAKSVDGREEPVQNVDYGKGDASNMDSDKETVTNIDCAKESVPNIDEGDNISQNIEMDLNRKESPEPNPTISFSHACVSPDVPGNSVPQSIDEESDAVVLSSASLPGESEAPVVIDSVSDSEESVSTTQSVSSSASTLSECKIQMQLRTPAVEKSSNISVATVRARSTGGNTSNVVPPYIPIGERRVPERRVRSSDLVKILSPTTSSASPPVSPPFEDSPSQYDATSSPNRDVECEAEVDTLPEPVVTSTIAPKRSVSPVTPRKSVPQASQGDMPSGLDRSSNQKKAPVIIYNNGRPLGPPGDAHLFVEELVSSVNNMMECLKEREEAARAASRVEMERLRRERTAASAKKKPESSRRASDEAQCFVSSLSGDVAAAMKRLDDENRKIRPDQRSTTSTPGNGEEEVVSHAGLMQLLDVGDVPSDESDNDADKNCAENSFVESSVSVNCVYDEKTDAISSPTRDPITPVCEVRMQHEPVSLGKRSRIPVRIKPDKKSPEIRDVVPSPSPIKASEHHETIVNSTVSTESASSRNDNPITPPSRRRRTPVKVAVRAVSSSEIATSTAVDTPLPEPKSVLQYSRIDDEIKLDIEENDTALTESDPELEKYFKLGGLLANTESLTSTIDRSANNSLDWSLSTNNSFLALDETQTGVGSSSRIVDKTRSTMELEVESEYVDDTDPVSMYFYLGNVYAGVSARYPSYSKQSLRIKHGIRSKNDSSMISELTDT